MKNKTTFKVGDIVYRVSSEMLGHSDFETGYECGCEYDHEEKMFSIKIKIFVIDKIRFTEKNKVMYEVHDYVCGEGIGILEYSENELFGNYEVLEEIENAINDIEGCEVI